MNRLPLEEKKLRMEGKIYFFSGSGADSWTAAVVVLIPLKILLRILHSLNHEKLNRISGIYLFRPMISYR